MQSKKLKLEQQPIAEDRISALPDELCCHILSLIENETKYAVRTSVLSTRWKNLWKCVPNLHFSKSHRESPSEFASFVNRVLLSRKSLAIQKFHLQCHYSAKEISADIDTWVRTAIRCNVVELDLCIFDYGTDTFELHLPDCLFSSKSLVNLKLKSSSLAFGLLPKSGRFPSLKFLDVTAVTDYILHSNSDRQFDDLFLSVLYLSI